MLFLKREDPIFKPASPLHCNPRPEGRGGDFSTHSRRRSISELRVV
jgi:hypothetical protein